MLSLMNAVSIKKRPKLYAVDYIQLLEYEDTKKNRAEQLNNMCDRLKNFALENKVAVLILAQLTKNSGGLPPELRDIRDSSGIAASADCVLLLNRMFDDGSGKTVPVNDRAEIRVRKNRFGRDEDIVVLCELGLNRFRT